MIHINNLSYRYPDGTLALDGVDMSIEKGEFVALIGKNGCGKTTLVRHLNALLTPTEGSVSVFGMDTKDRSGVWNIRQTVGMVFQNPQTQFVGTTLEEDVAFGPENLTLPPNEIRKRVDRSLREVGLLEYKTHAPKALSGGQMQRAAIAGVLAMEPECIVLDEVTSMLDPGSRGNVLDIIQQLHQRGNIISTGHGTQQLGGASLVNERGAGGTLGNIGEEGSLHISGIVNTRWHTVNK